MMSFEHTARHCNFFRGMSAGHLNIMMQGASERAFSQDEILFREGEPASEFYVIQSGAVAIESHIPGNGDSLIQKLGPGDVLGWSWMMPPFVWHFQARAIAPTQALILKAGHLLAEADRDPGFGYDLMVRVAAVVVSRLKATRDQLLNLQVASPVESEPS